MIMQCRFIKWLGLGRSGNFPTQYDPYQTPVTVDVLEVGLITAFVILGFSFLVSLPTTGLRKNVILFTRVSFTLLIGGLLLVNNFGQEWEVGRVKTKTPYRAGTGEQINASISIKIALRSVNVTLSAPNPRGVLKYETINYNERFEWTWDQGRFGFGPFAGHLQQQYRAAQYRGLPLPILWIMDYFVIDGEGFRFGRFYRTAGWYTHMLMWAAFACWLIGIILFRSVISYGAYFLGICGVLQLGANFVWLVVCNPIPLVITFEDGALVTRYGFNYWATFCTGITCIVLSSFILLMHNKHDQALYTFFGVNPLNSYGEVVYLTKGERLMLERTQKGEASGDILLVPMDESPVEEEDVEYVSVYVKRNGCYMAPKVVQTNKPCI